MPPPKLLPSALLPDTVVWKRIKVEPERFRMPPPPRIPAPVPLAWLSDTTSPDRFKTPALRIAPPWFALPWVIVRLLMATVVLLLMSNTLLVSRPLMLMRLEPRPLIVTLSVMLNWAVVRVIVP